MDFDPSLNDLKLPDSPATASSTTPPDFSHSAKVQWCESCFKQAQEMEKRHKKSIDIIKKKILFTDQLIGMYTQMKASLEDTQMRVKSLELQCKRKETDNQLVNKQLKALLSDNNASELEQQRQETASLKLVVDNLNDQLSSMEMTKKMLELKISSLNEELKMNEVDWKKYNAEKDNLVKEVAKQKKSIASLQKENASLIKKNEVLQERLRKKRNRGSGSFSHTTDSEHNTTAPSEDMKTEGDDASSTVFKSPLPGGRKKRYKRKRRKSLAPSTSDDEETSIAKKETENDISVVDATSEVADATSLIADATSLIAGATSEVVGATNEVADASNEVADASNEVADATNEVSGASNEVADASNEVADATNEVSGATSDLSVKSTLHKEDDDGEKHSDQLKPGSVTSQTSDSASERSKPIVATDQMKGRILEMKLKRAHRSFCNHPSRTQQKEMSAIVERLNEDPSTYDEDLKHFCSKHNLTGHEPSVTRKIERLHQDSLSEKGQVALRDWLTSGLGVDSRNRNQSSVTANSKSSSTANDTRVDPNSLKVKSVAEHTSPDANSTPLETTKEEETPPSIASAEQDSHVLAREDIVMDISPKDNPDPCPHDADGTNDVLPPPVSLFSSDDSDNDKDPVKVNIHSVENPEEMTAVSRLSRVRTRSMTDSLKDKADADEVMMGRNNKGVFVVKANHTDAKQSKTAVVETTTSGGDDAELPVVSSGIVAKKVSSQSEFSSDSQESDSVPLAALVPRARFSRVSKAKKTSKNAKKQIEVASNHSASIDHIERSKFTETVVSIPETTDVRRERASGATSNSSMKRKLKPSSPEVIRKLPKTGGADQPEASASAEVTSHPALSSFFSLPFSTDTAVVDSSPRRVSESFSFLSASGCDGNVSGDVANDAMIADVFSPSKLDAILLDITSMAEMSPLSPLHAVALSDVEAGDDRASISPSADLCTAISFSSTTAASIAIDPTHSGEEESTMDVTSKPASKEDEIDSTSSSCSNDAPRRFSCEAPTRARTVPSLKRVCKTQSLDPAAVSTSERGPVRSPPVSSSREPDPIEKSSKILPSNLKIITRSYSGPFKVVSSSASPGTTATESENPSNKKRSKPTPTISTRPTSNDEAASQPYKHRNVEPSFPPIHPPSQQDPLATLFQIGANQKSQSFNHVLKDFLTDIQPCADISSFSSIPLQMVVSWLSNVAFKSRDHRVIDVLTSQSHGGDVRLRAILHEWEYEFVTMLIGIDRVRSEARREIIESQIIPTIAKLLCRFGTSMYTSQIPFKDTDDALEFLTFLLKKGKLETGPACSLVRLLSCLSRSVGRGRNVIDFCRFAIASKSLNDVDPFIVECIACFPAAFSKQFPLSGKLLIASLASRADKHCFSSKSDQFKQDIKNKVHQLEILLGWSEPDKSVLVTDQHSSDLYWKEVLEQCVQAIRDASFVDAYDRSRPVGPEKDACVVALAGGDRLVDVYTSLEIVACNKSLLFVTAEIIDSKFWPLLNSWSIDLVTLASNDENRSVSNACLVSVLDSLTALLLTIAAKQQVCHPSQPFVKQAVAYFKTLCALLANFSTRHLKTAPYCVQCATLAAVLKLAFYEPILAYKTAYDWFEATAQFPPLSSPDQRNSHKKKGASHPLLPQLVVFYPDKSMKRMVVWLESRTKSVRKEKKLSSSSLTTIIWGQ